MFYTSQYKQKYKKLRIAQVWHFDGFLYCRLKIKKSVVLNNQIGTGKIESINSLFGFSMMFYTSQYKQKYKKLRIAQVWHFDGFLYCRLKIKKSVVLNNQIKHTSSQLKIHYF